MTKVSFSLIFWLSLGRFRLKSQKTTSCIQKELKVFSLFLKSAFGWRCPCVEVYFLFLCVFLKCYLILWKKKEKKREKGKRELRGDITLGREVEVSEFLQANKLLAHSRVTWERQQLPAPAEFLWSRQPHTATNYHSMNNIVKQTQREKINCQSKSSYLPKRSSIVYHLMTVSVFTRKSFLKKKFKTYLLKIRMNWGNIFNFV